MFPTSAVKLHPSLIFIRYASACKAIVQNSFGPSSVLEMVDDYKVEEPKKKEVLVEVYGSSVNPLDCQQREGFGKRFFEVTTGQKATFPICPGCEFSGKVLKAGPNSSFKVGDRVFGASLAGKSWAERICINDGTVALAPKTIPLEVAGTFPKVAISVSGFLKAAKLRSDNCRDKRVFINGGSGGIGTFTIQLLKSYSAKEIAVTCGPDNVELCSELGAHTVINYKKEDFREVLRDFDVYLDCINSNDEDRRSGYGVLRKGGHYLTLVFPWIGNTDESGLLWGTLRAISWLARMKRDASKNFGLKFDPCVGMPDQNFLVETATLIDAGKMRSVVSQNFSLEDMKMAHDIIDSGRAKGKLNVILKKEEDFMVENVEG
ncbi:reticulon-4-interacting protein 1 homolog, mitochondrial-like [Rhopilema esculentum]|uniref:reticulon-4-interacting protein 1 homolog, mitochondrial-like n=1 Tax=Rhopilema esculentum TaxID=499914 RepID=UPI0031DA1C50|eukprot:gene12277-2919_t